MSAMTDIFTQALIDYNMIQTSIHDERLQSLQDRRFYSISGAQWEGNLEEQFENKPRFEVNKIHLSVMRIINEYRNNRITVDFLSKDGIPNEDLADVCDGLYRADEQDSGAEEAYDNAFEEAVGGGFGAWRLRTEYEDEGDPEDDRQRIRIEPIFDADTSVFFDLQAKRQDKRDARFCFVVISMTRESYKEEWGDDPASWPKEIEQYEFDWDTPDIVYIAEYYKIEEIRETIHIFEHLNGEEERLTSEELDEDTLKVLKATGAQEIRTRKIVNKRVHKYILSGGGILEDCGYIAGSEIPIIPVYGKRWFVDNVERYMGHVRLAKDSQRLKNMQISKLAEISALSPLEKPIFTPEQVAGVESLWEEDNIKNYPYQIINPVKDMNGNETPMGPVGYTKPPQIPPTLGALLQLTDEDMEDLLGNTQKGEELNGNVSTDTAMLVQNRIDMQTYIYMSNMAKAVKRSGEIWLSMAKEIFVEEGRTMKAVNSQGVTSPVELMRRIINETGEMVLENDLTQAKFDIVVAVGPSSSTQKIATTRTLLHMISLTEDAQTRQVLSAMVMMNMEGEGIQDVHAYFRKQLIKMGVVKPTEKEAQELEQEQANTPPPPQEEYLRSAAAAEQARGVKAQADTILTQAKADETRAKTAETLIDMSIKEQEEGLKRIERLRPRVAPANIPGSKVVS